jgi:hypothetical protein
LSVTSCLRHRWNCSAGCPSRFSARLERY